MNRRCPNCNRMFSSYWTGQKYCCYNCAAEAEKGPKKITIGDVLSLGGERRVDYGKIVSAMERGKTACITRG